jgi:fido (protein-threonine AMPylation protein)
MIFLIEYDRPHGELIDIQTFDDSHRDVAENARLRRELTLHQIGVRREVVLLQAASENALRETHRRYFADIATLAGADFGSIG